ncbi:MAG: OmpH family outer membrane protein [Cyclobacteriaceae bacterium]|nr:OmpH family outer membrane protein [Cyclobacteriaceae bacterium]
MSNKLLSALCIINLVVLTFFVSYSFIDKPSRIVYVDALTLVSNYQGMKDAKVELERKISTYQANLDTLKLELDAKTSEYEANKSKLTLGEKKLSEDLILVKQEQFENYQQIIQNNIQNENIKITQDVLNQINAYVKRYGEEKNFDLILASTQYGNIIYGVADLDITNTILKGLNSDYQSQRK